MIGNRELFKMGAAVLASAVSAVSVVTACASDSSTAPRTAADSSAAAIAYLDSAIDIIETHAFYRARVDWTTVRANAHQIAAGAIRPSDTYSAIVFALAALGDHHSKFVPPVFTPTAENLGTVGAAGAIEMHPADSLDGEIVGGRFGYVRVPTFSVPVGAPQTALALALADSLQALVRAVDNRSPCGWIVDLRHNLGGNMWPMLVGIGPIVGGAPLGSFLDAYGNSGQWFYANGSAGYSGVTLQQVDRPPYTLRSPNPPVAVLTDSLTASSGEAITVAFRGRPSTRSFGAATYGVPSANTGFTMPDKAVIILTTALDVDRLGRQYGTRIPPDQAVPTSAKPATDDSVVAAAMTWLSTQDRCAT